MIIMYRFARIRHGFSGGIVNTGRRIGDTIMAVAEAVRTSTFILRGVMGDSIAVKREIPSLIR